MDITLRVPVPRYVAKYIRVKLNLQDGQAWKIHTRGIENTMIISLLERNINRYEEYRKNQTILLVDLPAGIYLRKGTFLSQENIDQFCTFIKDRIQEEIQLYCFGVRTGIGVKKCDKVVTNTSNTRHHDKCRIKRIPASEGPKFFSQKDSITDILEKYSITDADLRFDSVLKHVQRRVPA